MPLGIHGSAHMLTFSPTLQADQPLGQVNSYLQPAGTCPIIVLVSSVVRSSNNSVVIQIRIYGLWSMKLARYTEFH